MHPPRPVDPAARTHIVYKYQVLVMYRQVGVGVKYSSPS